jgi:rubrerythrin
VDTNELGPNRGANRGASRRRFLQAGAAGAVASVALPVLTRSVSAQAGGTPPLRPTSADVTALRFAQGVELAARDLYELALAGGGYGEDLAPVMAAMSQHHRSYAQAISGLLGPDANGQPNEGVLGQFRTRFSNPSSAISAAARLEDTAVATHTELLGTLEGTDGAALIASILVVEARHATVLATAAGVTDLNQLLTTTSTPLEVTA